MAERHEESGARRVMKIVAMVLASAAMALSVLASGVGSHIQTQYQQEQWEQRVDEANDAYEHHLWDELLAPSFWLDEGPAKDVDDSLKENEIRVGELDELGRATGVKAKLTKEGYDEAKDVERNDISNIKPTGWTKNREVDMTFPSGESYHGWFWNRSHLLAHSLGGPDVKANLVTGTRAQNVGDNKGDGGMAHCEETARTWLSEHEDGYLYYAATPVYEGDELVCRSVYVDMKSSDGTIDTRTEVYNAAPGYTIEYATGTYSAEAS